MWLSLGTVKNKTIPIFNIVEIASGALRRLTTAAFGTLMSLEPAIALAVGLLLLGQVPGWVPVAGIGLVVLAGIGAERTGARSDLSRQEST